MARRSPRQRAPQLLPCLSARTTHHSFPASDSAASGRPSGRTGIGCIRLLTSGIQIRLTKPFAHAAVAEADFAGGRFRGCLKLRQIIKAALDHRNARIPLRRCSQGTVKRCEAAPIATCDGGKGGPCGFRQGAPVARSPCRKQYGRNTKDPRRLFASKSAGPVRTGLRFKRFRKVSDGFQRNHGKVRKTPRRFGCGRHRHGATPARLADAISGIPSGARRRSFSPALRSAAAGGKRYNAQQNAYRRLPPGGNAGCRRSR